MARYFDEMRAVVERHGGTVEKFIGDAVMAVFGVPVLHKEALAVAGQVEEARATLTETVDVYERKGATVMTAAARRRLATNYRRLRRRTTSSTNASSSSIEPSLT
jgi:class 3 adenylate cyclase